MSVARFERKFRDEYVEDVGRAVEVSVNEYRVAREARTLTKVGDLIEIDGEVMQVEGVGSPTIFCPPVPTDQIVLLVG